MQRFDRAHNPEVRYQFVVCIDQQLGPRPIDRHRLDSLAVARQAAILDDAAFLEQLNRFAIGHAIERYGQIELVGGNAKVGARHRDPLGVASELEFRRGWSQRSKVNIAVRENEDSAALDASVNAPRHLQNLVRAKVETCENIFATLDDVAEASVVDNDGVEAMNIEGALTRGGHRQEVGLGLVAFQERANDSNRLAAVI